MALKPIRKRRLFEDIILALEDYILEKKIKPGERLPFENELASIFNVSKTAVREAMSVLHANGIIETRSGSGIYLKEIVGETIAQKVAKNLLSKGELQEILEFRRGMEIEAASLAAVRANDEDLKMIKQAHQKLITANNERSLGVEEDYSFHYAIIVASHNSIYKSVFDSVSEKFREGMRLTKMQSAKLPERFKEGHWEHKQIIEALFSRDAKAASKAMRNHLMQNEKKIWTHI